MSSIDTPSGTPIQGAAALVTGGNRGFGRALVDELLERGAAKVYATSRSAQPRREDDRIVPLILDVADDTSVATDMTVRVDAPKAVPRDIARQTADAIVAGDYEILADNTTRTLKSQLSNDVTARTLPSRRPPAAVVNVGTELAELVVIRNLIRQPPVLARNSVTEPET